MFLGRRFFIGHPSNVKFHGKKGLLNCLLCLFTGWRGVNMLRHACRGQRQPTRAASLRPPLGSQG